VTGPGARDWDKELADIDKIIAKTPPAQLAAGSSSGATPDAPAPRAAAPRPAAAGTAVAAPVGRRAALSTWFRVLLGAALAVGMTQWPYFHACGTALFVYVGSIGVVGLAGLWGAVSSWRRRMGLAHTVSLLVLLAGGFLAASEILPRIGYAKRAATWFCP
jgi:hypothetical protein